MHKRETIAPDGKIWTLIGERPVEENSTDFVVQMLTNEDGTRTAMNFQGSIKVRVSPTATDNRILSLMNKMNRMAKDLLPN